MQAETPQIKQSKFFLIFGAAWILFGLIFGSAGYFMLRHDQRFAQEGIVVDGSLTNKRVEEKYDSKEKRTDYSYYLKYQFKTESGESLEDESGVGSEEYSKAQVPSQIKIQYLKSDPHSSRIAGTSDATAAWIFMGVGLFLCLIGAAFLFSDLRSRSSNKKLLREGALTEGEVLGTKPGSLSINNVTQYKMSYKFKDNFGKEQRGETAHMPPDQAMRWQAGQKGKVRFDKNRPEKNLWVG